MTKVEFDLIHGYQAGEKRLNAVVMREPTAGDVIDANEESEKLVFVPDDSGKSTPQFVTSPTMVGINVLRRQIVRIGDISGPLSIDELKAMHPEDLNLLQHKADQLEAAQVADIVAGGAQERGRDDQSGAISRQADNSTGG